MSRPSIHPIPTQHHHTHTTKSKYSRGQRSEEREREIRPLAALTFQMFYTNLRGKKKQLCHSHYVQNPLNCLMLVKADEHALKGTVQHDGKYTC